MKKIGLAACYDTENYGSQLQLLANMTKISELGYNVGIICYTKTLSPILVVQNIPRILNIRYVLGKLLPSRSMLKSRRNAVFAQQMEVRHRCFAAFAQKHYAHAKEHYRGWAQLVEGAQKNYDGFVCGSDQLWLPNNRASHFFTLEFAPDNKPKIAYATSFGVSSIPKFHRRGTAKYLNRFQALSTREVAGQKIIHQLTGRDAQVVCDPTLLYDDAQWAQLVEDCRVVEEPYVFAYILGESTQHRRAAEEVKRLTGLKLVTCPFMDDYVQADEGFGDVQIFDAGPEEFVNLIRHAEYVLTDSFHGTVFSILHQKKFLTFNRFGNEANSRNSRIDSLCELLKLQARRYDGSVEKLFDEIDYEMVGRELDALREASIRYLRDALELVKES